MKLKELRESNKLTQQDVGKIINVTQGAYNLYEKQEREISIKNLIILANYYNVSLDYLCGRQWNNQIGFIPDDKKEVVKLVLQLNETNTLKAFGYVSGLLAGQI